MTYGSAVAKLLAARRQIAAVAAQWQAQGIDTSPLTGPLLAMQEAIAELETQSEAEQFRALTRELRNHFNAVRASGAGLETEDDPAGRMVARPDGAGAADRCIETLDRMDQPTSKAR